MAETPNYHRQIAHSAIFVSLFLIVAKCIGAAKEIAIAYRYGTTSVVDSYSLAFNLANWPISVFTMSAGMIIIPLLVQMEREAPEERQALLRSIMGWSMLGSLVLAIGFAITPWAFRGLLGPKYNGAALAELRQMVVCLAAMIPGGVAAALLAARLMSGQKFVNTLFEAIPSVIVMIAIFCFRDPAQAPLALGIGTSVGFALYALALLAVQPPPRTELIPSLKGTSALRKHIGRGILVILAAQMVFSFGGPILDQLSATRLPAESNAVLGYANRLLMLVITLGATVVGRATLPVLSAARRERAGAEKLLAMKWSAGLFMVGVAAAGVGYLLAPFGVDILFHRGAFDASDLASVTSVLRAGLWQIPFYFSGLIFAQMLASQRRYGAILACNTLALVAKFTALSLLMKPFGLIGVMLSTSIMYAVVLIAMIALTVVTSKPKDAESPA